MRLDARGQHWLAAAAHPSALAECDGACTEGAAPGRTSPPLIAARQHHLIAGGRLSRATDSQCMKIEA